MYGVDMDALQAMDYQLISGSFVADDLNLGKKKIPVLIGEHFAYEFQDTRKSPNSGKRQRYWGETDSLGNPVEPSSTYRKEKLTLRLTLTTATEMKKPRTISWWWLACSNRTMPSSISPTPELPCA